jgi:RecJ-like exonuclease
MTNDDELFDKYRVLKKKAKKIAQLLVDSEENIIIVTSKDPDNLCATGILLQNLKEKKIGSHVIYAKEKVHIEKRIKKLDYRIIVFIGLSLSEIPLDILKDSDKKRVVIHHELTKKELEKISKENIEELSLKGISLPTNTVSNAGLCYFISAGFNGNYQKYSHLAIIGSLAKKQVNNKNQSLIGLNGIILEEGKKEQFLMVTKGTRIAGRESQPIHLALKYSINPYFPGLTGNESACTSFLSRIGITMKDQEDEWRNIASLSSDETKKLNDGLISILMENKDHSLSDIKKLIGPIYIIENESKQNPTRNIEEFLWLLEGACQMSKHGLALAVILGDRENLFDQLSSDLSDYHGRATLAIDEIAQKPEIIEKKQYYRIMKGDKILDKETTSAIIIALIESKTIPIDVPVLVSLSQNEDTYLFVHESPLQQKKGIKLYHIFHKALNSKLVKKLSKEGDSFEVIVETDNFPDLIKSIEETLEYHHEGTKEKNEEEEKSAD